MNYAKLTPDGLQLFENKELKYTITKETKVGNWDIQCQNNQFLVHFTPDYSIVSISNYINMNETVNFDKHSRSECIALFGLLIIQVLLLLIVIILWYDESLVVFMILLIVFTGYVIHNAIVNKRI